MLGDSNEQIAKPFGWTTEFQKTGSTELITTYVYIAYCNPQGLFIYVILLDPPTSEVPKAGITISIS